MTHLGHPGGICWWRAVARGGVLACALAPAPIAPAQAHPHIFVDAGVEAIFDDSGQLAALRIAWVYDDFFSMLMVSDLGLDPDFTGSVTDAERAELDGFDMNWIEGYHGDVFVTLDGKDVSLSGPLEWTSDYRDGRLMSTHLRALPDRVRLAGRELVVSVHDPSYYTSYTIVGQAMITGRSDCSARIFEPDWEAADARLQAALDELLGSGVDIEAEFPPVGALFAEEVRITCAGPS